MAFLPGMPSGCCSSGSLYLHHGREGPEHNSPGGGKKGATLALHQGGGSVHETHRAREQCWGNLMAAGKEEDLFHGMERSSNGIHSLELERIWPGPFRRERCGSHSFIGFIQVGHDLLAHHKTGQLLHRATRLPWKLRLERADRGQACTGFHGKGIPPRGRETARVRLKS